MTEDELGEMRGQGQVMGDFRSHRRPWLLLQQAGTPRQVEKGGVADGK